MSSSSLLNASEFLLSQDLSQSSKQIKRNLVELKLKRKCLLNGFAKWSNLSERARKNMQGSEILAAKYPITLRTEAVKLERFYKQVNARLLHEKADIEAQIVSNDNKLIQEAEKRKSCKDEIFLVRQHTHSKAS